MAPLHDKKWFFKYYTADAVKLTLKAHSRKWSTPALFNDPFDNQFDLSFEEPSKELANRSVGQFIELIKSKEPIQRQQFGDLAPALEYIRQVHIQNPDFEYTGEDLTELLEGEMEVMANVMKTIPRTNEEIRAILSDTSILCLSESCDSLLMWSHYAQNHSGAVIQFLSLEEVDSPLLCAQPVRYSAELPRLEFAMLMDHAAACRHVYEMITLSKSEVWSYEKEWRVVASLREKSRDYEILPFAKQEVGAVYLGCKMAKDDRNEIIDITRSQYNQAKLFQATKHDKRFALVFEELRY